VAGRIIKRWVHQHGIATCGRQPSNRVVCRRRGDIERNCIDPAGELVARGIEGRERRKVGTDVYERDSEARHTGRQRQAGGADTRTEIDGAVAGWRGGGEQDGVMPEAMAAAWLP